MGAGSAVLVGAAVAALGVSATPLLVLGATVGVALFASASLDYFEVPDMLKNSTNVAINYWQGE